ncbi:MAG: LPS assembly lipoprotein LptE [Candidatus Omnitrophica bacterium]|nr:LPS assembly lipoprotein LptE [Candidatus Omnitrophota bacterium]
MKIRFFGGIVILIVSFTLMGCGYTTRSIVGNKFRTIYIAPFANKIDITREVDAASKYKIYKPMLEADITKAIANKFLFDGNLKPTEENMADLVLRGELIEFRRDPLRYTEDDDVEEYRINLVVNLVLWDRHQDKLVWEERRFVGDTTYFVTGTAAKSEDIAIREALDDLARRVVERTVETW